MAERLKDLYFTRETIDHLAEAVLKVYPAFAKRRFLTLVFAEGWESLELKAQMHRVTRSLGETLPQRFADALPILKAVVPEIQGFDAMVFPDFVEMFGQEDWDAALQALAFFTRFASAEFAVRPFLDQDPERALPYLLRWAADPDPQVRRLASEGCRPRLPWAMALPRFKEDPAPILPILQKLNDDQAETVRRSVANNLNDISKDHPDLVLDICESWSGQSARTDWIVKHACRGLLKAGNRRALDLFGFSSAENIAVVGLELSEKSIQIGDKLRFSFALRIGGEEPTKVRLEYGVYLVKAKGGISRKIFQISERGYPTGTFRLEKSHSFEDRSTRKHYPGVHELSIIVNGEEKARATFNLVTGHA